MQSIVCKLIMGCNMLKGMQYVELMQYVEFNRTIGCHMSSVSVEGDANCKCLQYVK